MGILHIKNGYRLPSYRNRYSLYSMIYVYVYIYIQIQKVKIDASDTDS